MKAVFFALALIAGISAAPQKNADLALNQRNLVEDLIRGLLTVIIENIENSGLDPLEVASAEGTYTLLGEDILTATGSVSALSATGLSQVTINDVTFSLITGVNLDVTLAGLKVSAGSLVGHATVLGNELEGEVSGTLNIENVNLRARISVSILPSISIRGITGSITVGSVEADLKVINNGEDVSEKVNDFLNNGLQEFIDNNNATIFEYIQRAIVYLINSLS